MVDSKRVTQRGLGYDIVGCAVKIAFSNLDIDSITAEIFSDKERSLIAQLVGEDFGLLAEHGIINNAKCVICRLPRDEYQLFFK